MAFLAQFSSEFFMTTAWRWVLTDLFGFIADYGWRVIFFTVCLKLLLSPFDFLNRKRSKDTQRAMRRLKPEFERLEKECAGDQRELMMRKRALQKKHKIGGMGMTCLTSIITLFIFLTLWNGFTSISQDMNINAYKQMETQFTTSYTQFMNPATDRSISAYNDEYWTHYVDKVYAPSAAGKAAISAYKENYKTENGESPSDALVTAETQRLAKNAFYRDNRFYFNAHLTDSDYYATYQFDAEQTGDAAVIVTAEYGSDEYFVYRQAFWVARFATQEDVIERYDNDVKQSFLWVKNIWRADTWTSPIMSASEYESITKTTIDTDRYNEIMLGVTEKYGTQWNGYLILVVLTVVVNFLTQFLMQRIQKKSGEADMQGMGGTMKVMMWIMPIMMAIFAFSNASAFTIYMVTNGAMSLFLLGASTLILNIREKRIAAREAAGFVVVPQSKQSKNKENEQVLRGVRAAKPVAPKSKKRRR